MTAYTFTTAPQAVTNLSIISLRNTNNDNTVTIRITWTPPSLRNGSFDYMLTYSADQTPPYPQQRRWRATSGPVMVDGSQQQYVVPRGLPYTNYQVTIYAFNIKRDLPGPSEMTTHRSLAIGEFDTTQYIYVPRNLGICAISRLYYVFSESRDCTNSQIALNIYKCYFSHDLQNLLQ